MMVALWDMVAKASNLAQLLGLDAVTLIATIAASSLRRFHQANKECRKLEGRVRMLLSSVGGHWITQQQQQQNDDDMELAGQLQVASVLRDATDLVESYKRSTLYARVRGGSRGMGRMATRFRDLRSRVDSCCHLILAVNAFLLVVQPPNQLNHPPPSLVIRTEGNDDDADVGVPPSTGDSVHAAAETSSTASPDDTDHVIDIDITPARQE